MCESDEEGTAAGGTEANNPEYIACVGLAVDAVGVEATCDCRVLAFVMSRSGIVGRTAPLLKTSPTQRTPVFANGRSTLVTSSVSP